VLLQRLGVTAIVVLTEPFRTMVEAMLAYQETDRPLPAVVLDHPMQNITPDEIDQRARQLADAAERLLAGGNP
jgi:dienelactone hydrolase